jgi:hypothetical protein
MTLWVTTKDENSRSGGSTEFQRLAAIFEGDHMHFSKRLLVALIVTASTLPLQAEDADFGQKINHALTAQSEKLFGFNNPLARPADATDYVPRQNATAGQRVLLANGLHAEFVTRNVAVNADMIAFWPDSKNPTHLIVCIEQDRAPSGTNPGVQRVELSTGNVATILFGTKGCDGIRTTAWGTILATEEEDDGRAYEIIDPLTTTGHWIENRATGVIRTTINGPSVSDKIAQRPALPTMAWEGIAVLANGVVIAGDELRPGSGPNDSDGGAIFKYLPTTPHVGGTINHLNNSPLVTGKTYAMVISCQPNTSGSFPQVGQGCEVGQGAWVRVNPLTARSDAQAKGATGYYRPEDLHQDPLYAGPGVRFCWTNTGNEGARHYAEVLCGVDNNPLPSLPNEWLHNGEFFLTETGTARANATTVIVNRFLDGDLRFNSFDNLEFQPIAGNVYVVEDHQYGEIFACLPDGQDRDIRTDGCVAMLSVIDPLVQWFARVAVITPRPKDRTPLSTPQLRGDSLWHESVRRLLASSHLPRCRPKRLRRLKAPIRSPASRWTSPA